MGRPRKGKDARIGMTLNFDPIVRDYLRQTGNASAEAERSILATREFQKWAMVERIKRQAREA